MAKLALNRVQVAGNLVKDVVVGETSRGELVCNFSLAVKEYKDNEPTYIDIVCWGKLAEVCEEKLTKGSCVFVIGKMRNERWETEKQVKIDKLRVYADEIQFIRLK